MKIIRIEIDPYGLRICKASSIQIKKPFTEYPRWKSSKSMIYHGHELPSELQPASYSGEQSPPTVTANYHEWADHINTNISTSYRRATHLTATVSGQHVPMHRATIHLSASNAFLNFLWCTPTSQSSRWGNFSRNVVSHRRTNVLRRLTFLLTPHICCINVKTLFVHSIYISYPHPIIFFISKSEIESWENVLLGHTRSHSVTL